MTMPLRRRNGGLRRVRSRRGHSHLTDRQALWLGRSVRLALADHWRDRAEFEHASALAHHHLALRLTLLDAPDDLVRRALQAAERDRSNARRCFDLAGRYRGESRRPARLRRPRPPLWGRRGAELRRLAADVWRDGILLQGYSAWWAAECADRTGDERARETLHRMATSAATATALAVDVLAWCRTEGGADVTTALQQAVEQAPRRHTVAVVPAGIDRRALADHGLSDPDAAGDRFEAAVAAARALVEPPPQCTSANTGRVRSTHDCSWLRSVDEVPGSVSAVNAA